MCVCYIYPHFYLWNLRKMYLFKFSNFVSNKLTILLTILSLFIYHLLWNIFAIDISLRGETGPLFKM